MLKRVKDLRTTIPGLLIGLALIAAAVATLRLQPDWDWKAVVGFVGGISAIALGALSHSSGPEDASPPKSTGELP